MTQHAPAAGTSSPGLTLRELSHPKPGVYLVGMKSYGRAPAFLAVTGYEQVRSVAAATADHTESAERVELTCRTPASAVARASSTRMAAGAGSCRAPAAPEQLMIGRPGQS